MKLKSLFAAALLVIAAPSMASQIEIFNLGNLTVPGGAGLGNSFGKADSYEDQYKFTIDQAADAGGLILALDLSSILNINVTNVSLVNSVGESFGSDFSPGIFSFNALPKSNSNFYTLSVFSTVTSTPGWSLLSAPVGYVGLLSLGTTRSTTSVPEPGTLALFGAALVGVALTTRRRALRN